MYFSRLMIVQYTLPDSFSYHTFCQADCCVSFCLSQNMTPSERFGQIGRAYSSPLQTDVTGHFSSSCVFDDVEN